MEDMTQEQVLAQADAVAELDAYGAMTKKANRDRIIKSAFAARVSKSQIARRMGVGRSTVDAVLGASSKKEQQ